MVQGREEVRRDVVLGIEPLDALGLVEYEARRLAIGFHGAHLCGGREGGLEGGRDGWREGRWWRWIDGDAHDDTLVREIARGLER